MEPPAGLDSVVPLEDGAASFDEEDVVDVAAVAAAAVVVVVVVVSLLDNSDDLTADAFDALVDGTVEIDGCV